MEVMFSSNDMNHAFCLAGVMPLAWKETTDFIVCTVYSACCSDRGQKYGLHWQQEGIRQPHTARLAVLRAETYDLGDPKPNRCVGSLVTYSSRLVLFLGE